MREALDYWFAQHSVENCIEWQNFPYVAQEKAKIIKAVTILLSKVNQSLAGIKIT